MTPVSKSEAYKSVAVLTSCDIFQIFAHKRIVFCTKRDVARKIPYTVRQFKKNTIPYRTAAPVVAPAGSRNHARKLPRQTLCVSNYLQKMVIIFCHIKQPQPGFTCKHGVTGPAVFFAVRAVARDSDIIADKTVFGTFQQFIGNMM